MNDYICLALVVVALVMILLGTLMTVRDSRRRGMEGSPGARADSFEGSLKELTALLKALRDYPPGMWLIVMGVVLLIIAAMFCGISGLVDGPASSTKA